MAAKVLKTTDGLVLKSLNPYRPQLPAYINWNSSKFYAQKLPFFILHHVKFLSLLHI